jgi:hypothetical protein
MLHVREMIGTMSDQIQGPRQGDVVIWDLPQATDANQTYFVYVEGADSTLKDFKGRRALARARQCARELAGPHGHTYLKDADGTIRRL